MKKLLLPLVALVALVTSAFSQDNTKVYSAQPKTSGVQAQSTSWSISVNDGFSLLYLRDGYNDNYAAISYKVYQIPGLDNRLSINALGARDTSGGDLYAGAGLSFELYNHKGFKANVIVGYKGFNLNDFSLSTGQRGLVVGFGLTIPLGSVGD